jgi:hypothetical protein
MPPVAGDRLYDRQSVIGAVERLAAGGKPLGDQPIVFGVSGLGAMRP